MSHRTKNPGRDTEQFPILTESGGLNTAPGGSMDSTRRDCVFSSGGGDAFDPSGVASDLDFATTTKDNATIFAINSIARR